MKKLTILLLTALLLTSGTQTFADNAVWAEKEQLNILRANSGAAAAADKADLSGWAQEEFDILNRAGLLPLSLVKSKLSGGLTRLEFCELIVPLYKKISGLDDSAIELASTPYDDCDALAAAQAYSLGFIATTAENTFDPTGHVTRQEMAVTLIYMLEKAGIPCALTTNELAASSGFEDFSDADSWAYNGLAKAVSSRYISGADSASLLPHEDATRSQMIAAAGRIYKAFFGNDGSFSAPTVTAPADSSERTGSFAVNFNGCDDAKRYHIIVKDINYDCVCELTTRGSSVYVDTGYFVDGEDYTVIAAAEYSDGSVCFSQPITITYKKPHLTSAQSSAELAAKEARVFDGGARYSSAEEASANMLTVTVPVWRLASDGSKYESKHSITVNKNLADDVIAIFTEIFEDESRFPIKDIGCYCWRNTLGGAQSQHSFGTCIDINYNENYYVSATGRALTGAFWQPYDNPYSITPDGIVVKAFAKYGWLWAGNAWGEGYAKDYMHMTYLGG